MSKLTLPLVLAYQRSPLLIGDALRNSPQSGLRRYRYRRISTG